MNLNNVDYEHLREQLLELFENYGTGLVQSCKLGSKLVSRLKKGNKIYIKKKNRGKFTESAKRAGLSVQEHAKNVLNNPNATALQKKRANFARNAAKWKHKEGGTLIPKYLNPAGKLPIGTKTLYDHVVAIYQSLVDKGVNPQAALELVNQEVAEKGCTGWATGDNKKYPNVNTFTDHLIDWHGRMYPDSLKSKNFELYWRGILETSKYKYNSENPNYKSELLKTRPGVKKRVNHYRSTLGLPPLAYLIPETSTINVNMA